MTTPINKTTPSAREILERVAPDVTIDDHVEPVYTRKEVLSAIKEAAQLSFEAGDDYRFEQFALNMGLGPTADVEVPNKETFITNLMRDGAD